MRVNSVTPEKVLGGVGSLMLESGRFASADGEAGVGEWMGERGQRGLIRYRVVGIGGGAYVKARRRRLAEEGMWR